MANVMLCKGQISSDQITAGATASNAALNAANLAMNIASLMSARTLISVSIQNNSPYTVWFLSLNNGDLLHATPYIPVNGTGLVATSYTSTSPNMIFQLTLGSFSYDITLSLGINPVILTDAYETLIMNKASGNWLTMHDSNGKPIIEITAVLPSMNTDEGASAQMVTMIFDNVPITTVPAKTSICVSIVNNSPYTFWFLSSNNGELLNATPYILTNGSGSVNMLYTNTFPIINFQLTSAGFSYDIIFNLNINPVTIIDLYETLTLNKASGNWVTMHDSSGNPIVAISVVLPQMNINVATDIQTVEMVLDKIPAPTGF